MLGRACFNGASEMVTNLSMAVTTFLFNAIMMAYLGEAGVSAITIVLYAQFLLVALYMGFSMGVAPVFSFNRGAGRYDRMRRIFGYCLRFILVSSVAILAVALALSGVVVGIFSTPGSPVYAIALDGFRRFAPAFLFAGVNIFSSALFTALSDGRTSAIISFARTFGFLAAGAASAAPVAGGGRRVAGRAAGGAALLPAVGLVPPPQAGRLRLRRWGSPPTRWTRRRTDLTEAKLL
ncbi:MAG: MATE family efflux transporter [Flavonifractor plautii]